VAGLFTELKRRNVFRVGAAYGIVGWLLVEIASVLLPTFEAPDWVMNQELDRAARLGGSKNRTGQRRFTAVR
jgi:hypothetical protein